MPDLIFVSMENWDEIWRRNQFLVSELAQRYPESKILFVGTPQDVTHGVREGNLTPLREALSPQKLKNPKTETPLPNVFLLNPPKWLPKTLSFGRRLNDRAQYRAIRKACTQLKMESPLLWLNAHSAVDLVGNLGESGVIYDVTDDWTQLAQSDLDKRLTISQDAELCRKADAVIVCSERLYELKRKLSDNVILIPNGVDAAHYAPVLDEKETPLPEIAAHWEKPVYGYTGTIHPDRVDVGLVEAIAKQMTKGTLALVGPILLTEEDTGRLLKTGRVVLTGGVPYNELPDIMRAFDVCMTPHLVTPFTESLNPIKLWEYLAAGKPIVSTPVAGFRDYPQFVACAKDAGDFLEALQLAEREPESRQRERRHEVGEHSWHNRVDRVEKVIAPYVMAMKTEAHLPKLSHPLC